MKNIIQALSKPENAATVSIFVPGELLTGSQEAVKYTKYVTKAPKENPADRILRPLLFTAML